MNAHVMESLGWSRNRWVAVFLGVLTGQLSLIWLLSESPVTVAPMTARGDNFIVAAVLGSSGGTSAGLPWRDPTLFVLPGSDGFSRGSWLAFERPKHKLQEWEDPQQWLRVETAGRLMGTKPMETVRSTAKTLLTRPIPKLPVEGSGVRPAAERNSTFQLDQTLQARGLVSSLKLPEILHTDLVGSTVVEVLVRTSGEVFSARAVGSSGLRSADQQALVIAQGARFRKLKQGDGPEPLELGRIVFDWATVQPGTPATNAPNATK